MKRLLCVLGAAAVGLSVWYPVVRVSIVGNIDGFEHWPPAAYLLAAAAVIALGLAVANAVDWAWLPGYTALGVAGYTLYQLCEQVSATTSMGTDVPGNPLTSFATGLLQTIQLQWGIGVLLLGGFCLLGVAFLPADAPRHKFRDSLQDRRDDSEWGEWN